MKIVGWTTNLPGVLPDLLRATYKEFRPSAARRAPAERIVVLIWGENPTYDYYILPRLGGLPSVTIDISKQATSHETTLRRGDYVILCRYLTVRWARLIAGAQDLAGVGLFFDDDYTAFFGDRSVPLLYRLDVVRRTIWPLRMIRRQLSDVLVSTETLRERYHAAKASILGPVAGETDTPLATSHGGRPLRIAFHAQLSHLAEHAFVANLVREMHLPPGVTFDVIGPAKARRLWANVPSAQFTAEMDWPDYRQHSRRIGADILIAPMLDTPLNQARAATKAIDAMRMGAAAILPRANPYRNLAESAVLVEGGVDAWRDAIGRLVGDRAELRRRASLLRAEVESWRGEPLPPKRPGSAPK